MSGHTIPNNETYNELNPKELNSLEQNQQEYITSSNRTIYSNCFAMKTDTGPNNYSIWCLSITHVEIANMKDWTVSKV